MQVEVADSNGDEGVGVLYETTVGTVGGRAVAAISSKSKRDEAVMAAATKS